MEIPLDINLPEYLADEQVVNQCIRESARHYSIPELLLKIIRDVEGGKVGTLKRNSNNSVDIGIMQINTINVPAITRHFGNVG